MCSLSIMNDSVETTSLVFSPWICRPLLATMKPRDSALSSITGDALGCE